MANKPDVAVGELLRKINDWQYGRSKPTMGLDEAHSLLRCCHAALSALPAEPKQDDTPAGAQKRILGRRFHDVADVLKIMGNPMETVASPPPAAEPKQAQRFNLMPLGMFPSDTGLWVRYNEHLAIVAALEKQLPIRPTPATQEQWLPGPGVPSD